MKQLGYTVVGLTHTHTHAHTHIHTRTHTHNYMGQVPVTATEGGTT